MKLAHLLSFFGNLFLGSLTFSIIGAVEGGAIAMLTYFIPAWSRWTQSEWGDLGTLMPATCGALIGGVGGILLTALTLKRPRQHSKPSDENA